MRRYSSATVGLLSSALGTFAPFTCLSPSRRILGVSGGGPWGLIDVIVSLNSTQSSRISRPKPPVLLPPIRDRGMWCLRLPGYVRGMASLLGSPRRSRRGGTTACRKQFSQHLSTVFILPSKMSYHNKRAEAAEHQTPENGGLVARGPVDVLARRGPESDGSHDVYVVICCC